LEFLSIFVVPNFSFGILPRFYVVFPFSHS
jgi:hypothetical protein